MDSAQDIAKKIIESPIGLAIVASACTYGAYSFVNKSVFGESKQIEAAEPKKQAIVEVVKPKEDDKEDEARFARKFNLALL